MESKEEKEEEKKKKKKGRYAGAHVATINLHSDVIGEEQVTEQEDSLSARRLSSTGAQVRKHLVG